MAKTWLITVCSTGFGKVLTEAVLARGDQVVATARDPSSLSTGRLAGSAPAASKTGAGRIVNFSSLGGLVGRAGSGFYNSTKFAVEGLSEALAQEVAPLGIAVILAEPGPFRTEFPGRSISAGRIELRHHGATAPRRRSRIESVSLGSSAGMPPWAIGSVRLLLPAESGHWHHPP